MEKLRHWGSTYAAARAAERAAAQSTNAADRELQRKAQLLREHANRLHGEIYRQLDQR